MNQIDLREGARRQHRATAVFAVIQCWLRNLDGLCFGRAQLERLLGLERFKQTRVEWLQEDLRDFFPYQETYWYKNDSFASLFVARRELKPHLAIGEMSDEERIKRVPENGPRLGLFRMWPRERHAEVMEQFKVAIPFFADYVNYDERFLASYLTLLVQGQISPRSVPSLQA